jgi:hypothetical protein
VRLKNLSSFRRLLYVVLQLKTNPTPSPKSHYQPKPEEPPLHYGVGVGVGVGGHVPHCGRQAGSFDHDEALRSKLVGSEPIKETHQLEIS